MIVIQFNIFLFLYAVYVQCTIRTLFCPFPFSISRALALSLSLSLALPLSIYLALALPISAPPPTLYRAAAGGVSAWHRRWETIKMHIIYTSVEPLYQYTIRIFSHKHYTRTKAEKKYKYGMGDGRGRGDGGLEKHEFLAKSFIIYVRVYIPQKKKLCTQLYGIFVER